MPLHFWLLQKLPRLVDRAEQTLSIPASPGPWLRAVWLRSVQSCPLLPDEEGCQVSSVVSIADFMHLRFPLGFRVRLAVLKARGIARGNRCKGTVHLRRCC